MALQEIVSSVEPVFSVRIKSGVDVRTSDPDKMLRQWIKVAFHAPEANSADVVNGDVMHELTFVTEDYEFNSNDVKSREEIARMVGTLAEDAMLTHLEELADR